MLVLGLRDLAGQVKEILPVLVVLSIAPESPVLFHVCLVELVPSNLTVHEMANYLIHGRVPALARHLEENLQPFCWTLHIIRSEDGVADVEVVLKLLLVGFAFRQSSDVR